MSLRGLARSAAFQLGLAGAYYRFDAWRRGETPGTASDGAPVPPLHLMRLVFGDLGADDFLRTGEAAAKTLADAAAEAGVSFRSSARILDFGCGCGRVIRHLPKHTGASLFGSDYNPALVNWCAKNLKGDFRRNRLRPPLDFPSGHFDVLYLLSVFTHLRIETQREWLSEFQRVLRPGGLALVTFHDEEQMGLPDGDAPRATLRESGVYIHNDRAEGSNLIATFQSRDFSRKLFGEKFEVARIIPSRENPIHQAIAALRRPIA